MPPIRRLGLTSTVLALTFAACSDGPAPTQPDGPATVQATSAVVDIVSQILERPQTVYGGLDEATGQLLFGVENEDARRGVETALARRGFGPDAYRIAITDPIYPATALAVGSGTLRTEHRPTMGGLQIHWSNYVCTLGFNVQHSGGASFVTNSHCTENQGSTGSTQYFQPLSSVNSNPIAIEADDPQYFRNRGCSKGKKCRYSDASRALYQAGVPYAADIARTTGENNGSLDVSGAFDVTGEDDSSTSFSGTVHKVGRTTGWTSGSVSASCVTVNVSGSNLQLLCQTIVESGGGAIVGGGDSGSPVFRPTGSNTAALIGILWGGAGDGSLFVFSPLASIEAELGSMTVMTDGVGGGGDGGDGGDGGGNEKECPPNSNAPRCR